MVAFPGAVGLFHQLDGKIALGFLTRFPTPRHTRWMSDKRLATWLNTARYTRPNTRTPQQLMDHLRQAPAGLPEGPSCSAAAATTGCARLFSTSPTAADKPTPGPKTSTARARARGLRHAHAVRVLARAWLRVIWRCWTDHFPYNPTRHLAAVDARRPQTTPEPTPVAS